MFPTQKLVWLLPFLRTLAAQVTILPDAEARLIAWRAYGSFISDQLTAGVPIKAGSDFIYVTPPNMAAVRGGTPCPASVTDYDLFGLADALQNISEPLLDTAGASYIDNLYTYLESVDLKTATPTAAQLAQRTAYLIALGQAQQAFNQYKQIAYAEYQADVAAQAAHQTYSSWLAANDPYYAALEQEMEDADATLQNYEISLYGPQYRTITNQKNKIYSLAKSETVYNAGYNMQVYPGEYTVSISPWASHEQTDGTLYKPLYSLNGGFEEQCDTWFNGTNAPTTTFNWDMNNVDGHNWSALGHSGTIVQGGVSIFSLISVNLGGGSQTTTFDSWSSTIGQQIKLELTMKGAPVVFNVGAGYWDVGAVRSTYPNILTNAVDPLANRVKISKILVGYEIGLTITINDTNTWNSLHQVLTTAQKSAGGGFSIFGFHFGGGASTTVTRNVTEPQFKDYSTWGQIVIPPSAPGLTFMLGALGKAL